jgi:hypothetical protein
MIVKFFTHTPGPGSVTIDSEQHSTSDMPRHHALELLKVLYSNDGHLSVHAETLEQLSTRELAEISSELAKEFGSGA